MTRNSRRRWRLVLIAGLLALVAAVLFFFWPRRASLRAFNPESVARLETVMWRHYYEREYASLFRALYALARDEYRFSPWDSARLSFYAAKGAGVFQRSHSRDEAQQALPMLERYYSVIRTR